MDKANYIINNNDNVEYYIVIFIICNASKLHTVWLWSLSKLGKSYYNRRH